MYIFSSTIVYDIPELVEYVDWFSVNTIDYNGPDQEVLQCASPLTPQTLDDSFCIVSKDSKMLINLDTQLRIVNPNLFTGLHREQLN